MSAANTIECIEEFLGQNLTGLIEDWPHGSLSSYRALVFESGRALVLGDNGSYRTAPADEVQRVIGKMKKHYGQTLRRPARLLALAGQKVEL